MRQLLLLLTLLAFYTVAQAQPKIQLSEKTVVKDSSGTVYPYAVWQAMMAKGYMLKALDPKDPETAFLLVKPTAEQLAARMNKAPKPKESPFFTTGKKLSLFKTSDINGRKIDLRDSTGKIIVLNFWFVNCPPCRREIPDLNDLVDSFKTQKDVLFYAIALDDAGTLKDFLKLSPFHYTIIDNGRYLADRYGIKSYPTHVVLDRDGKVYFHTVGLASGTVHWLKKSIETLLSATPSNGTD